MRPVWAVQLTLAGWTAISLRRVRPSRSRPNGYLKTVGCGVTLASRAEAVRLVKALNARKRPAGLPALPSAAPTQKAPRPVRAEALGAKLP